MNKGYYDDVPVEKALAFEASLRQFVKSKYAALMDKIEQTKDMDAEGEKALVRGASKTSRRTARF